MNVKTSNTSGALDGITVLDLTRVMAGPYCSLMLADMGANVIKIENPDGGDDTRSFLPAINGVGLYYANLNRNKKGITLNLKSEQGKAMFLDMVKKVDVVIENYRTGVMDKLGLGYSVLSSVNERIIFASVSGFGSYGPYKDRPGYDIVAQAMGGLMDLTGIESEPATKIGSSLADQMSGMYLSNGILAALVSRATTGKGQYVEVALVDSIVALSSIMYADYINGGEMPTRIGNEDRGLCPFSDYRAKDGNFIICCGNQKLFETLCTKVLKRPDLLQDERFKNMEARSDIKHHHAFRVYLEQWTTQYTVEENLEMLLEAGIPCSQIYNAAQVFADEHIAKAREMFVKIEHPLIGEMTIMGNPIKLQDTKVTFQRHAPLLGEHNEEVYEQMLGIGKAQLDELKKAEVI